MYEHIIILYVYYSLTKDTKVEDTNNSLKQIIKIFKGENKICKFIIMFRALLLHNHL